MIKYCLVKLCHIERKPHFGKSSVITRLQTRGVRGSDYSPAAALFILSCFFSQYIERKRNFEPYASVLTTRKHPYLKVLQATTLYCRCRNPVWQCDIILTKPLYSFQSFLNWPLIGSSGIGEMKREPRNLPMVVPY